MFIYINGVYIETSKLGKDNTEIQVLLNDEINRFIIVRLHPFFVVMIT